MGLGDVTRREFCHIVAGVGAAALVSPEFTTASTKDSPSIQIRGLNREDAELLSLFNKLSRERQDSMLAYLDQYFTTRTSIGQITGPISQWTLTHKIPEEIDDSLRTKQGEYNILENKIRYISLSNQFQMQRYVLADPSSLLLAHERIHAIQYNNSRWRSFMTVLKDAIPEKDWSGAGIALSPQKIGEFARDVLKIPKMPYNDGLSQFSAFWNEYILTVPQRNMIAEVHAFLTTQPYTNPDILYKRLAAMGTYKLELSNVSRDRFNVIFNSTIELVALLDPVSAAEFVGRNGDSVENYTSAVENLKRAKGVKDAYQRGINRQNGVLQEFNFVRLEAIRLLSSIQ